MMALDSDLGIAPGCSGAGCCGVPVGRLSDWPGAPNSDSRLRKPMTARNRARSSSSVVMEQRRLVVDSSRRLEGRMSAEWRVSGIVSKLSSEGTRRDHYRTNHRFSNIYTHNAFAHSKFIRAHPA